MGGPLLENHLNTGAEVSLDIICYESANNLSSIGYHAFIMSEKLPFVYSFFEIPDNVSGKFKAKCKECHQEMSGDRKATSSLLTHLKVCTVLLYLLCGYYTATLYHCQCPYLSTIFAF